MTSEATDSTANRMFHTPLPGRFSFLTRLDTRQLAGSDERAGEGHRTDENTETQR